MRKAIVVSALVALPLMMGMVRPALWIPTVGIPTATTTAFPLGTTSVVVGETVHFDVSATPAPGCVITSYQWDFGDLTPDPASGTSFRDHVYTTPGHYTVSVVVTDVGTGGGAAPATQMEIVVHHPLPATKPTNSSTIILDPAPANRIWVVNPDQDTVATFSTSGAPGTVEIPVGKNPRTLAQAGDKTIWVVSQSHPSISILDRNTNALLHVIPLPHGSAPYGICMTPDGSAAYVSFQGSGGVWKISTATRQVIASGTQPPSARGIAVAPDGRVLVTRFISPQSGSLEHHNTVAFAQQNRGEVVMYDANLGNPQVIPLAIDPGQGLSPDPEFGASAPPAANGSRGVPNYLTSLVITPDGRRAWIPSKKDNIQRGIRTPERDGRTPSAEVAYRAIVSSIDLTINQEQIFERVDVDNSEMPQAACVSPLGDFIFIALQGTNKVQVRDLYDMDLPLNGPGEPSGTSLNSADSLAPQGLVLDPAANRLYVQNYMGRTVAIFNVANILNGTAGTMGAPVSVLPTVLTADLLGNTVRDGKRVFYNAGDPRMSLNGYISCAGCHLDGGSDMRVFDFTNRNEGFRNTVMLQGRAGTGHGNVHWSANFDEIQDFDNDVYFQFHFGNPAPGPGPANSSFTLNPNAPMGAANAGRDAALDAMAAYVASLDKVARSPFRNADGTLTATGAAGEAIFKTLDCQRCHGGSTFTDSKVGNLAPVVDPVGIVPPNTPVLHNVGTIRPTSGKRLGQPAGPGLTLPGIDTPTLKGIWQTAPFFHDGSAATMRAVIDAVPIAPAPANAHGGMHLLTDDEKAALERYMIEIDELDAPPVPAAQDNSVELVSNSTSRPYSLATSAQGRLPYVDRSYAITTNLAGLAPSLDGRILLRTHEDDKNVSAASHLTFTLDNTSDVYIFFDSRAATLPTWVGAGGWTALPSHDLTITPGLVMNAYRRQNVTGTVTLGGNAAAGAAGALRNYFVIIHQTAGPVVFEEGPIAQREWVHQQDGDGDGLRDDFEAVSSATVANLSPWKVDSNTGTVSDEDLPSGGSTLFAAQPPPITMTPPGGGFAGGGGGGGGGCGLGGLEFLLPLLAARLITRRRK